MTNTSEKKALKVDHGGPVGGDGALNCYDKRIEGNVKSRVQRAPTKLYTRAVMTRWNFCSRFHWNTACSPEPSRGSRAVVAPEQYSTGVITPQPEINLQTRYTKHT